MNPIMITYDASLDIPPEILSLYMSYLTLLQPPNVFKTVKSYKGSFVKVEDAFFQDMHAFFEKADMSSVYFAHTPMSDKFVQHAQLLAKYEPFSKIYFMPTGSAITMHWGENAMLVTYLERENQS